MWLSITTSFETLGPSCCSKSTEHGLNGLNGQWLSELLRAGPAAKSNVCMYVCIGASCCCNRPLHFTLSQPPPTNLQIIRLSIVCFNLSTAPPQLRISSLLQLKNILYRYSICCSRSHTCTRHLYCTVLSTQCSDGTGRGYCGNQPHPGYQPTDKTSQA